MNRVEFTRMLSNLLNAMFLEGENPIIDYVKRSKEEQMRLFAAGKSKCDGVKIVSKHQRGLAADIYFLDDEMKQLTDPKKGWEHWHNEWIKLGGKPMIEWDKGHFEV